MPPVRRKLAKASSCQAQNGNVFLWSKRRCLLRIDDWVQKLTTAASSSWMCRTGNCLGTPPTQTLLSPVPLLINSGVIGSCSSWCHSSPNPTPPTLQSSPGSRISMSVFAVCLLSLLPQPSLPLVRLRCQTVQGITIDVKLFRVTFSSL